MELNINLAFITFSKKPETTLELEGVAGIKDIEVDIKVVSKL